MVQTVQRYIDKYNLLKRNDKIVVGLSGGADSVALIHVLKQLDYTCIAAHCNFHLRGEEADQDERFAQETAKSLHILYEKKDFDTIRYAESHHLSIEMAARQLRYQWFETLRKTYSAQAIAVAHHQDDSVETVLLNLIRGTGIRGLRGIKPKNGYVIRPLLAVNRAEIILWLEQQKLTYRSDSSNFSDIYTRNVIRRQLLPLMEKINPSVREAILRTSKHLSDTEVIYQHAIEQERSRLMYDERQISISELLKSPAPQTVLYELIRSYGFTRTLSQEIFHALRGESGKLFYAPDTDYHILKDRDFLIISDKKEKDETIYPVKINETLDCPIRLSTEEKAIDHTFVVDRKKHVATFDRDKINEPLTIRTWRKGDWFIPFGMRGKQKLSDYFSDHKFSRLQKENTWLLCCGNDILWIIGERTDNRYRVEASTKKILIATVF